MKRTFWGVVLIILGVLAMAQMTGYNFGLAFWPVVWLLVGLSMLWGSIRKVSWFGMAIGMWVGGIGLLDILHNAGVTWLTGGDLVRNGWPLLLIAIGLSVLFGRHRWYKVGSIRIDGNRVGPVGDLRWGQGAGWRLDQDLDLKHGVGDLKVDLTTAEITEGVHNIRVRAGVGEVVLRVPDDMTVSVSGRVGIGDLRVLDDHRSGIGLNTTRERIVPDSAAELRIDIELGIGQVTVVARPGATLRVIK